MSQVLSFVSIHPETGWMDQGKQKGTKLLIFGLSIRDRSLSSGNCGFLADSEGLESSNSVIHQEEEEVERYYLSADACVHVLFVELIMSFH